MLQPVVGHEGVVYYQSSLLAQNAVPHAFSTRNGGVSQPPFDSMNLGVAGDKTCIDKNFDRFQRAIGCGDFSPVCISQVHGAAVHVVEDDLSNNEADAVVTDRRGVLLAVRTADCVPILIHDPATNAVSAIHAGWRGMVAGVIGKTISVMEQRFGSRPSQLFAAIGPCIGSGHFEVGEEVVAAFEKTSISDDVILRKTGKKPHVNLSAAASDELVRSGLLIDSIERTDRCTFEHAKEFFSHRRDAGRTGRMAAVIARPRD